MPNEIIHALNVAEITALRCSWPNGRDVAPVTIGDQDHRRIAMPPAVLPSNFHQTLNLGLGQVLAGPQVGIGRPLRHDCSVYDAWRDEFEVRFGHVFGPPSHTDCWDNVPSLNSPTSKTR
jgi:hypothetical protein